jgi:hypothetical protein
MVVVKNILTENEKKVAENLVKREEEGNRESGMG